MSYKLLKNRLAHARFSMHRSEYSADLFVGPARVDT